MDEIRLGSRTLQPHRQLLVNGRREPIGKRALDILSVLAEAGGGIVTKDELLDAVWPGVTVEENALQVHIVALRKALGPEADRLKTIRGVGYQLDVAPSATTEASPMAADVAVGSTVADAATWRHRANAIWGTVCRYRLVLGLIAALLVVAGAWATWSWPTEPSQEVVQVEPFDSTGGEPARAMAQTLHGELLEVLNESRIPIAEGEQAGLFSSAPRATRLLRGTVTHSGGQLKADLVLEDAASGTPLWSRQFERDTASADELATEASVAVARTIYTIRELGLQRGLELDPEIIALHIRGNELIRNPELLVEAAPRAIYEQIVARAPRFAAGRALLARTLASEAERSAGSARAGLLARAESEAHKAIAIDPASAGAAYDALYNVSRIRHPRAIAAAEDWLLVGLAKAPEFAFLWMRECRVLTEVGRAREALPLCQRGLALHPFAEPIFHSYARALGAAGEDERARHAIGLAAEYSPSHDLTRMVRLQLAAFGGRPNDALILLENPATRPQQLLRQREAAVLSRYLHLTGPDKGHEARDLAHEISTMALRGEMRIDVAVMALASLGALDEAFAVLRSPQMDQISPSYGVSFLFQPVTAPLRADPRFWTVAAERGLAQHWTERGQWPDMCRNEFDLEFCKAQTARALRRR